ncbi:MAG: hypothetical protein QHC79_25750 [Pseudosphingobacterium sp.]|nr:hypothetical protein [Pseudosphingobacterium sp.]
MTQRPVNTGGSSTILFTWSGLIPIYSLSLNSSGLRAPSGYTIKQCRKSGAVSGSGLFDRAASVISSFSSLNPSILQAMPI